MQQLHLPQAPRPSEASTLELPISHRSATVPTNWKRPCTNELGKILKCGQATQVDVRNIKNGMILNEETHNAYTKQAIYLSHQVLAGGIRAIFGTVPSSQSPLLHEKDLSGAPKLFYNAATIISDGLCTMQ